MAVNFLIALAIALGSATLILLVLWIVLKVAVPEAFKQMITASGSRTVAPAEGQVVEQFVDEVQPLDLTDRQKDIVRLYRDAGIAESLEQTVRGFAFRWSQEGLKNPNLVITKTAARQWAGYYVQLAAYRKAGQNPSAEQDPTLKKKVKELEMRIRQLEVQSEKSVLESQESDTDKLQAPQTIH
jgi:hypothetical protein